MYSFVRRTTVASALFLSACAFAGCSSEDADSGKMDAAPPVTGGKMDTGAMDGMGKDSMKGKMDDTKGKMDTAGKDKMEDAKGKMDAAGKDKMESAKGKMEDAKGKVEDAKDKAKTEAPPK